MNISAFGIEHEIEKFGIPGMAKLTSMGGDALKGLKIGAKGRGIGAGPGSAAGQLAAKVGNTGHSTAQFGRRNLKPIGIGAGVGTAGAGGLALANKNN